LNNLIYLKIGGSVFTDKNRPRSLHAEVLRQLAREIVAAHDAGGFSLLLGHGAGSWGHIPARKYRAVDGVHPRHGWRAFHLIRREMAELNLRFLEICAEADLHPVTLQPSALATARGGRLESLVVKNLELLLEQGQVPLLHGDIVPDRERGFTIISTEELFSLAARELSFREMIMISDVPGVLDRSGRIIERINGGNLEAVRALLSGSGGVDVTGGMRHKVEQLWALVSRTDGRARIVGPPRYPGELSEMLLGRGGYGTVIEA